MTKEPSPDSVIGRAPGSGLRKKPGEDAEAQGPSGTARWRPTVGLGPGAALAGPASAGARGPQAACFRRPVSPSPPVTVASPPVLCTANSCSESRGLHSGPWRRPCPLPFAPGDPVLPFRCQLRVSSSRGLSRPVRTSRGSRVLCPLHRRRGAVHRAKARPPACGRSPRFTAPNVT